MKWPVKCKRKIPDYNIMVILFVWLIFKASIRFTALSTRGVELERHLLSVNLDISSQA